MVQRIETVKATFHKKDNLVSHIRIHEKKKSFQCNDCKAAFLRKDKRDSHIKSVHEKKKSFKCAHCKAAFSRKDNLRRQMKIHAEKNDCLNVLANPVS